MEYNCDEIIISKTSPTVNYEMTLPMIHKKDI